MTDTKFTVAIHILLLLAKGNRPLNSNDLAQSIGTNASYIRKVMVLLKDAGILKSQRGQSGGITLLKAPNDLTLLDIYKAVEKEQPQIFQIHQNSNKRCPVGRNIKEVVFPFLSQAEQELRNSLANDSLSDVINRLEKVYQEEQMSNESSTTH